MDRMLKIIIALLTIIVLMAVLMAQGCQTANGLHSENRTRNAMTKWNINHPSGRVYSY